MRENMNAVPGLIAATQKPRELTRKELKELAALLDDNGFSEAKLRRAYGRARNADIAAHIIGFVRQAALGDPLVPYATRVENARAARSGEPELDRRSSGSGCAASAARSRSSRSATARSWPSRLSCRQGGFERVDREFDHGLETVLQDLNEAIWGSPAA